MRFQRPGGSASRKENVTRVVVVALTIRVSAACAQDSGVLDCEMSERAVQQVDRVECPADLAGEGRSCRITIHNDAFHVFAFEESGEQRMVGPRTRHEDQIEMELK
jgi:hypothetical protein